MNNVVKILYFMIKMAGDIRLYGRGKYRREDYSFDEECMKRKSETRDASRIKYWERRKMYGKSLEKKEACGNRRKQSRLIN
jgi:hypothetical protein